MRTHRRESSLDGRNSAVIFSDEVQAAALINGDIAEVTLKPEACATCSAKHICRRYQDYLEKSDTPEVLPEDAAVQTINEIRVSAGLSPLREEDYLMSIVRPEGLPEDIPYLGLVDDPSEEMNPFVYRGDMSPEEYQRTAEQHLATLEAERELKESVDKCREQLSEAIDNFQAAIANFAKTIIEIAVPIIKKFVDTLMAAWPWKIRTELTQQPEDDIYHWVMYECSRKRRVRKKYRNRILRERAGRSREISKYESRRSEN